jgi:hypothetical protein
MGKQDRAKERKERKHEERNIPVGVKFSVSVQTGFGAYPASLP